MENILSSIENAIKEKYGSLDSPDYSFLSGEEEKNPYEDAMTEIRAREFSVADDTDFNTDVSFHYRLEKNGDTYFLRLSLVGRFAVLTKMEEAGISLIGGAEASDRSAIEILATLKKYDIPCLDEAIISRPFPISLIDLEEGEATVFNALFSTDNYR